MTDLTNPVFIYLKGILFALGAVVASVLLWIERPTLRVALLLAIAIWCSARAYYFAFYVIERYVDPSYKFSGLGSFVRYWLKGRSKPR